MTHLRTMMMATLIGLSAATALAQGGGGMGPGGGPGPMGPGPAASAGGMGMGPGMGGRGMGPGRGAARAGSRFTPGWGLMSAQERAEHRDKMRAMTSYDECKAYRDQHHEAMAARAKERGVPMPAQPRRDACGALKR